MTPSSGPLALTCPTPPPPPPPPCGWLAQGAPPRGILGLFWFRGSLEPLFGAPWVSSWSLREPWRRWRPPTGQLERPGRRAGPRLGRAPCCAILSRKSPRTYRLVGRPRPKRLPAQRSPVKIFTLGGSARRSTAQIPTPGIFQGPEIAQDSPRWTPGRPKIAS